MKPEKLAAVFFAAVIVLGLAASAGAVDGTIDINQAKVTAAGGFPFTIGTSGSYRLTGNLTVPGNKDGIAITASNVTIDLNGFSISGPGVGSGNGISSGVSSANITVENGTVTGFQRGIEFSGNNDIVKSVHADSNSSAGILTANNAVIEGCTANSNSDDGIICGKDCAISGNTANNNGITGISVAGPGAAGLILHNNISGNTSDGIFANDATTGYGENVLNGNGTDVSGGTSMKNNVCSGVLC
jgi:parallel beta-helix repeat protein